MKYTGIIKNSRTLDMLSLYAILESVVMTTQDELANLGLTPTMMSLARIAIIGVLGYLRFQTTGPVGEK